MPSGSGGGGGGSHFSGGHSGSHGSYNRAPVRPIIMGHYYLNTANTEKYNSKKGFGVLTLILGLFMFLITFFMFLDKKQIEEDHNKYIKMITKAENDPTYQREGKVTTIEYNDEAKKYYFNYIIKTDTGFDLEGYTYSVYSEEAIHEFYEGQVLMFAVSSSTVTLNTDSINMGYKDLSLEDDGEYINRLNSIKILPYVGAGFLVLSIPLFMSAESYKQHNKQQRQINNSNDQETTYCVYCGHQIPKGAKKCDNCGVEF